MRTRFRNPVRTQAGVSLIELMIALVLGLVVVAGATAVFTSNRRTYGTSETLNRIQENERSSFEIMSRDLREAGGNPCSTRSRRVNHLVAATPTNDWWNSSADGIRGYGSGEQTPGTPKGSGVGQRLNSSTNNDAVDIHLAADGNIRVTEHDNPSANLQVTSAEGINVDDIVMVCNQDYQMIFKVTQLNSSGGGIGVQHNGGGGAGGNCSQVFQVFDDIADCATGASGPGYCFTASTNPNCTEVGSSPAQISRVFAARWYIGNNGRAGTSLYRSEVSNSGGGATPNVVRPVEIAEGATGMTVTYLRAGQAAFVPAATITAADAWGEVVSVRVAITFEGVRGAMRGTDLQGTDGEALERVMTNVVTLRNREDML